jgi:hypothetical protein
MEEQRQAGNAPAEEILEEQAIEQQLIPMLGDELAAAATASGTIYLTLPGMCKALSLDTAGQLQRIRRYNELDDERFEEAMAYLREELQRYNKGDGPIQEKLF